MIDQSTSAKPSQTDRYPARCRACGQGSILVLRWTALGEVRKAWEGADKVRVDLRQPRSSTGQCAGCGSTDLAIGPAKIS